jgi:hypothetical protein
LLIIQFAGALIGRSKLYTFDFCLTFRSVIFSGYLSAVIDTISLARPVEVLLVLLDYICNEHFANFLQSNIV